MDKAFTLIELLVVVLVIGILAAIALPQYNRAVEKTRLSEAFLAIRAAENTIEAYILENGGSEISLDDLMELPALKYFTYNDSFCNDGTCFLTLERPTLYILFFSKSRDRSSKSCYPQDSNMGEYICRYLEEDGWTYQDEL